MENPPQILQKVSLISQICFKHGSFDAKHGLYYPFHHIRSKF